MAIKGHFKGAIDGVPQPDGLVGRRRRKKLAVGATRGTGAVEERGEREWERTKADDGNALSVAVKKAQNGGPQDDSEREPRLREKR